MEEETVRQELAMKTEQQVLFVGQEKRFEKGKECTEVTTISADTIQVLFDLKSCFSDVKFRPMDF